MKTKFKNASIVGAGLMAALLMVACEDTELTAPVDASILLAANPANVVIDPNQGQMSGTSEITATMFDASGLPLQGVTVSFSSGGGVLDPISQKTNSSGIAQTTLTLGVNDPDMIQVRAFSGAVFTEEMITKTVVGDNEFPLAAIIPVPAGPQLVGLNVIFDGSVSADPDGQITCFQWEVNSTDNSSDEFVQGAGISAIERVYSAEQILSVILRVSDDPVVGAACNPVVLPSDIIAPNLFSPNIAAIQYEITCDNPPPIADAGPDIRQSITKSKLVQLDGTGSFDNETPIDRYLWACGNGARPQPSPSEPLVFCEYAATGTYLAELQVFDQGDGTINPSTGTFNCQKSAIDQVVVEIFAP